MFIIFFNLLMKIFRTNKWTDKDPDKSSNPDELGIHITEIQTNWVSTSLKSISSLYLVTSLPHIRYTSLSNPCNSFVTSLPHIRYTSLSNPCNSFVTYLANLCQIYAKCLLYLFHIFVISLSPFVKSLP